MGACFAATSKRQHHVRQDRPASMDRGTLALPRERRRERARQPEPVRELAQRMQTNMANNLRIARLTLRVLLPFT